MRKKVEVPEVKLQAQADSKAEVWQEAINEARESCEAIGIYTDGSMSEEGVVGAGWYVEGGKKSGGVTLKKIATVWDGEVCGVRGALEDAPSETNILILSDSHAVIAAVKKAGRTGKARIADLQRVLMDIKEGKPDWDLMQYLWGGSRLTMKYMATNRRTGWPKLSRRNIQSLPRLQKGG